MNLNGGGRERFLPREGRLQAVVSSAPQVGRGLSMGDVGGEVIVALRTNFEDSPRLDQETHGRLGIGARCGKLRMRWSQESSAPIPGHLLLVEMTIQLLCPFFN